MRWRVLLIPCVLLTLSPEWAAANNRRGRRESASRSQTRPAKQSTSAPRVRALGGPRGRGLVRPAPPSAQVHPTAAPVAPAAAAPIRVERRSVAPAVMGAAERTAVRQEVARTRLQDIEPRHEAARRGIVETQRAIETDEAEAGQALVDRQRASGTLQKARRRATRAAEALVLARRSAGQRGAVRRFVDGVFDIFGGSSQSRALGAAQTEVTSAQEAVTRAGRAEAAAKRREDAARQGIASARERIARLEVEARGLEADVASATAEVEEAERALDREVEEFERLTRQDQALARLSAPERAARERAAERFGLRTALVSKPHEISQDAFATNAAEGRFAVADGVTQSRFSGEFAREVVRRWAERPPARDESFAEWLRPVQQAWSELIAPARAAVAHLWFNRNVSWVGHATFVGVALETAPAGGKLLRALGIGDAVLLQVRDGRVIRAWPNESSGDFTQETQAFPSAGELPWAPKTIDLPVEAGDEIFMMSDAIGSWTLREVEAGRNPFHVLRALNGPGRLQRFVDGHRAAPRRGNLLDVDDTTLVRFVVPQG